MVSGVIMKRRHGVPSPAEGSNYNNLQNSKDSVDKQPLINARVPKVTFNAGLAKLIDRDLAHYRLLGDKVIGRQAAARNANSSTVFDSTRKNRRQNTTDVAVQSNYLIDSVGQQYKKKRVFTDTYVETTLNKVNDKELEVQKTDIVSASAHKPEPSISQLKYNHTKVQKKPHSFYEHRDLTAEQAWIEINPIDKSDLKKTDYVSLTQIGSYEQDMQNREVNDEPSVMYIRAEQPDESLDVAGPPPNETKPTQDLFSEVTADRRKTSGSFVIYNRPQVIGEKRQITMNKEVSTADNKHGEEKQLATKIRTPGKLPDGQ